MDASSLYDILKHPNENGITVFVIGILFILGVYHFLLYFQHKDKAYLYYSLYVFLVFIGLLNRPTTGFIISIIQPFKGFLDHVSLNLIISYNLVYFIFAYVLLDFKTHLKNWHRFYFVSIRVLFGYAIILEGLYLITGNEQFIIKGHLPFTLTIYILAFIFFIPLRKALSPLKYYILIGTLFLVVTSLVVSVIIRLNLTPEEKEIRYSIFYLGLIIENIFFALALGRKQKLILLEKNKSKEILISKLQENEVLKSNIQDKLQQDLAALNKQAEADKLEKIKAKYDKEFAEMKISALRNQMNPHFIFNSLNSIKRYIIDNEKENAVYYLNKFSKLIRKILSASMEQEISLSEELETMELYVNIENIRFNNEINFSINIDENLNLNAIKVPSLILQPFLENAIWHGLSLKKEDKVLSITLEKEGASCLKIDIIDNGIGRKRSAEIKQKKIHKKSSIGIKLTKERLALFSKGFINNYDINFTDLIGENSTPIGTMVSLIIPLK